MASPEPDARREPGVGDELGQYRLEALAGEGGMGRVFRAVHGKLGRTVALKLLRRRYASHPDAIARFFQEARAVNVIRHPNIVEITDFVEGPPGGDSYYIMEWLDGESLQVRLEREKTLPAGDVAEIGRQVAGALAATHKAGFIHRDLKPENIHLIVRDGRTAVKILDFGVALLQGTNDGAVAGTPQYFSPETAAGRAVDGRSDIYSLGVVLWELSVGEPPFTADSLSGFVMQHMTASAKPLSVAAPGLPAALSGAIERCLEKKPEARFQTMEELEAVLSAAAAPSGQRKVWWIAAAGAAVLAVVTLIAIASRDRTPAAQATPPPERPAAAEHALAPPAPPSPPGRIAVRIASVPAGAEVYRDGLLIGVTPCVVKLPGPSKLEIKREGYHSVERDVVPREGSQIMVGLQPNGGKRRKLTRTGTIDPFHH